MCNAKDERPLTELEYVRSQMEEMQANIDYLKCQNERLRGENDGLRFALRCNGISGGDVKS